MTDFRMAIYDAYGSADVIRLVLQAEKPSPGKDQVRLRVLASSVNPKDTFVRKGRFKHLTTEPFPHRMGYDFCATIDAVGDGADEWQVGDTVFGFLNDWAGGAGADYVLADAAEIAEVSAGSDYRELAVLPLAAQTALQALRDVGSLKQGQRVLINGASGGVGFFAVQIAKALGAIVTAVASKRNEVFCIDAGAENFVCYDELDLSEVHQDKYDVVFDVFGNRSLADVSPVLTEHGIYVTTVPGPKTFADVAATQGDTGMRARMIVVESRTKDLEWIAGQFESGNLKVEIEKEYPLEGLAEAHKHVEGKHTRGKVCILIAQPSA